MTTRPHNQTADILEFPRKTPGGSRTSRTVPAKAEPAKPVPTTDMGSGWYHGDAIEEATHTPKH